MFLSFDILNLAFDALEIQLNTWNKFSVFVEKYSSGWRGAPAKGVGRSRGARVQIPLSPLVNT